MNCDDTGKELKAKKPVKGEIGYFVIAVRVKNCKQNFGLGPGILMIQGLEMVDEAGRGFDNPMAELSLAEHAEEAVKQVIEYSYRRVTKEELDELQIKPRSA